MTTHTAYVYKPKPFFILTFLVTFALWFSGAALSFREGNHGEHMFLLLPGLMTPFLLSLVFILRSENRDLKRDFVRRLTSLRLINVKNLPTWLLVMPLAVSLSIVLSLLVGESPEQFRLAEEFSFTSGFVPVFLLLMMAAAQPQEDGPRKTKAAPSFSSPAS